MCYIYCYMGKVPILTNTLEVVAAYKWWLLLKNDETPKPTNLN